MADKDKIDHDALVASAVIIPIGLGLILGGFYCQTPTDNLEQRLGDTPDVIEDAVDYGLFHFEQYYDADGDCYNDFKK